MIKITVPATSANLGIGYDTLGMAVSLYSHFTFERADKLTITGCPEEFQNENNLVYVSFVDALAAWGEPAFPVAIDIQTDVPVARGLGSSSTCVVAGIMAAAALTGHTVDRAELVRIATEVEGHPDNVAPAILGGAVCSFTPTDSLPQCLRYEVSDRLRFITVIPPYEVHTSEARKVVPQEIPLSTAVWQMGRIAGLLEGEDEGQTPLQKKLAQLGKYLGIVALFACAVIFVVGLLSGIDVLEIFMTAVSLAVSAIPEGLPAIVTIVLSIGVQRMVKKNALIRRLPAVETLGSASIICSDKTGTLTQNRMTLVRAYTDGAAEAEQVTDDCSDALRGLLRLAALCCDGTVAFQGDEVQHIGDPTETAIVLAAHRSGMPKDELNRLCPRVAELPFDSDRKRMTTVNRIDGRLVVIVKGAFDQLAPRCIAGDLARAKEINDSLGSEALRVLAVAYKEINALPDALTPDTLETDLPFLGLVGMIDPPRPEAKAAVATCRRAGIKPVMITGDHVVTASAIARELGILTDGDRAITGAELDAMTDDELDAAVEQIAVYARVSPENKIRIVKAWQRKGQVVSMTGDGVNDAPALKAADIGCAMGITGTDVAKGAADMTLTDDNFATIVDAVREGRGIYANIRKVVGFLLGTNIGEVITVFAAMLLWRKTPLLSMQLLLINLATDSLPAIALGMEAVEADVMDKKPKPKSEGLFAHGLGVRIVLQGFLFALLTLIGFVAGEKATGTLAGGQTLAFMVLALSQVVQAYNMRSDRSLFAIGPFSNHKLNWAALASTALVALVLFTPVGIAFGLVTLPWQYYLLGLGLILAPLLVMEIAKLCGLIRHHGRK